MPNKMCDVTTRLLPAQISVKLHTNYINLVVSLKNIALFGHANIQHNSWRTSYVRFFADLCCQTSDGAVSQYPADKSV